jgi:DMSO/TMAO reductase YedYZ molybdopterin-dependent catalytic subunit
MKKYQAFLILILFLIALGIPARSQEVTEHDGRKLTPLAKQRNTHIERVPNVDLATYRLKIGGKVGQPLELKYEEALAFPQESRVIDFQCVEGWGYTALWSGPRVMDLIAKANPAANVKTVIFYALGGTYSSSLPLEFVKSKNVFLVAKINNVTLPMDRGFPFVVAAEGKLGYKWVQWVERIELSDKDYVGYWEERGYSNKADIKK